MGQREGDADEVRVVATDLEEKRERCERYPFKIGDKVIKIKGVYCINGVGIVKAVDGNGNIDVEWKVRGLCHFTEDDFWNKKYFKLVSKLSKVLS